MVDADDERQPSPAGGVPVYATVPGVHPPQATGPPDAPPAHRWGLGAFVATWAVFLGVSLAVGFVLFGDGPVETWLLAVALGVPSIAAAAVAVLITVFRGNGPFVDLHLRFSRREAGLGLAFGFGGLFLTLPAAALFTQLAGPDASSAVGDVFGAVSATPAIALLVALLVIVVAPVCEEIIFRGLLWGGLTRLGAGRWVAFGVTTLIFALAHFELTRTPLLLVVSIPVGLARLYTDGLLAPIVAHVVNNLLPGIGLYLMLTGAFPALV